MLVKSLFFSALWASSYAQDFGVPLSWREFGTNRTREERISIAKAALDSMAPKFDKSNLVYNDIGFWPTGATVFSAMANFDHFTGQAVYKDLVTGTIKAALAKWAHFDPYGYNDDAMWWSTAAFYAYRAYGDKDMLNGAIDSWKHVSTFQITQADASARKISSKSFPINGTCNGASMVGGVFWRSVPDGDGSNAVNAVTSGLYLTLSAYLASVSSDKTAYINAATAAANWMKNADKNTTSDLILDTVNSDCTTSPWVFTYNNGKYLEGLNTLANVTGDSQWLKEMENVAVASVKVSPWQGKDGVITEGVSLDKSGDGVFFKSIFIRALNEIVVSHSAEEAQRDFVILLHSYIDVQYNALLELAGNGTTFSSSWTGPKQDFNTWGQAAALDVLVSAITANSP